MTTEQLTQGIDLENRILKLRHIQKVLQFKEGIYHFEMTGAGWEGDEFINIQYLQESDIGIDRILKTIRLMLLQETIDKISELENQFSNL